jgi:hypothetical protein
MVFYKGALSWENLHSMPLDELFRLNDDANRILEETKKNNGL